MLTESPDLGVQMAQALQRLVEAHQGGDELPADEAELALVVAVKGMAAVRELWDKAAALLDRGMEAGAAKRLAAGASLRLRAWDAFLGAACACGEAVVRRAKVPPKQVEGLEEAYTARSELRALLGEVEDILELLGRPRKPVNQDSLRKAREARQRGEGRDASDVILERKGRGEP